MAKSLITSIISFTVLLTVLSVNDVNAECCSTAAIIDHVCVDSPAETEINALSGGPLNYIPGFILFLDAIDENDYWIRNDADRYKKKCITYFCFDGETVPSSLQINCGVGACNIFGCNCDGGCRSKNGVTKETIVQNFVKTHNFTRKDKHKVL